jgi:hypothetical protein
MTTRVAASCAALVLLTAVTSVAQSPKAATYITDEEIKAVNKTPGVDRQIVSLDIGKLNEAIGIVHRGPTTPPAAARGGAAAGGAAPAAEAGRGPQAPPAEPCGEKAAAPAPGTATGISHDHQTENYIIVSGSGTLVTGGRIVNGRKSAPDSPVTRVLNGPSCSGFIVGDDVVKKVVKVGDVIVIPAGVPHGWIDITDHVDYLTVRPDPDRVLAAGYVHPSIKK